MYSIITPTSPNISWYLDSKVLPPDSLNPALGRRTPLDLPYKVPRLQGGGYGFSKFN
jgi:hypothetical protein